MKQPRYYVDPVACVGIIATAAGYYSGLEFGAETPSECIHRIVAVKTGPGGLLDLSCAINALQGCRTNKMMGGANRGIDQAIRLIKEQRKKIPSL